MLSLILVVFLFAPSKSAPCNLFNTDESKRGRCGPLFGKVRCNKNQVSWAIYCNEANGWCGNTESHQDWQASDIYDFAPTQCEPASCTQIKNFQWVGADSSFPTTAVVNEIDYSNTGFKEQTADNVGSESCHQATYQTTQETHWDIGMEISTSVSVFGNGVDVSVSASVGQSNSETSGTLDSQCTSYSFGTAKCPGRYYCKRRIIVSEVQDQTKEFTATLVCGGQDLPFKGSITIDGGFDVSYEDIFSPMGCHYHTTDYYDRANKQPFCDECSSAQVCDSCEPDHYLIVNGDRHECITYRGCTYYCQGTADSSVANNWQCKDPNAARQECKDHLAGNSPPSFSEFFPDSTLTLYIGAILVLLLVSDLIVICRYCCDKLRKKGYWAVQNIDNIDNVDY